MRRLSGLIFLMFVLVSKVFSQTAQEGLRFLEVDKFENAKKVFKDLYKKSPTAENAYHLGNAYYVTEKLDSASIYFNEGIKLDAAYPMNYVGLGKTTYPKNQQEGKKNFDKALELTKSKNTTVLNSIADFYIGNDKLDVPQAFTLLDASLKHDAKNPETLILRGDGYWRIFDGTKGVQEYEKALALNPKNPRALMKLGESYKNVKNFPKALEYYQKVTQQDSQYAPAYKELGDVYYKNKQNDKAIQSYKKYVSMADHSDDVDLKYAAFLIMNKDYTTALDLLKRMENKENINPVAYRLLAISYYEKGDNNKSMTNMEKYWAKMDSKKYIAADYEYYGKLLAKSGKDSLAVINMETSLQKDSTRYDLNSDLGSAYMKLGKFDKASQAFEKKIKKSGNTQDYYNLGLSYFYGQKFSEADTTFGVLIKYLPNYPIGYFWKARARTNLDPNFEKGLANPYFEKYIELTKNDVAKNKKDLIVAYEYLGYYHLLKKDKPKAKEVYTKLKEIDPGNKKAEDGLKIVNAK